VLRFRFGTALLELFWNRGYIESVRITTAEDFGVQGRGAFYDGIGAIRNAIQNHLFQVLTNFAMEPPHRINSESIPDEKVKVLKLKRFRRWKVRTLFAASSLATETGYRPAFCPLRH
jgi:glucose-6-phosphate 1-dehydrogenase